MDAAARKTSEPAWTAKFPGNIVEIGNESQNIHFGKIISTVLDEAMAILMSAACNFFKKDSTPGIGKTVPCLANSTEYLK